VELRVAALYDVHANTPALRAVLDAARDVDVYVFGGDLLYGAWPRETLELARSFGDRAQFILGNWERYLLEGRDEWTAQYVPADAVRDWPPTLTIDGVLYCHATPASDEGIVLPQWDGSDWSAFTQPFVVCGHTHVQFDLTRAATRIVNPGSVGLPTVRATAWWALITDGRDVELRTTEYDTASTARAMRETGFPELEFADFVSDPVPVERIVELVSS
jgi:diadenosine tetraphosphatase ApaH/serine/threonine PP2A family protein phosphatase